MKDTCIDTDEKTEFSEIFDLVPNLADESDEDDDIKPVHDTK